MKNSKFCCCRGMKTTIKTSSWKFAAGGREEAALFAGVLYRMYTMYADNAGFKTEMLGANETELGGFKEVRS